MNNLLEGLIILDGARLEVPFAIKFRPIDNMMQSATASSSEKEFNQAHTIGPRVATESSAWLTDLN